MEGKSACLVQQERWSAAVSPMNFPSAVSLVRSFARAAGDDIPAHLRLSPLWGKVLCDPDPRGFYCQCRGSVGPEITKFDG